MRTRTPRLPPLTDDQLDAEQEAIMAPFREKGVDNLVSRALVRQPAAMRAFQVWARYVMLAENPLPARPREILALRTAWRVRCGYVWAHHMRYAERAGLSAGEIEAIKRPSAEGQWTEAEAVLIAAADALAADFFIPDDIWSALAAHFDERQCIDAIFVVGHFAMLAMFLNSAGVPVGDKAQLDPDLDFCA